MVWKHWNSYAHSHVAWDSVTSHFCYTNKAAVNFSFMSPCVRLVRMSLGYIPGKEISTIHYVQLQFLRTVGILESSRVNFPQSPTVFDFYASSTTSLIVQFFCFFSSLCLWSGGPFYLQLSFLWLLMMFSIFIISWFEFPSYPLSIFPEISLNIDF